MKRTLEEIAKKIEESEKDLDQAIVEIKLEDSRDNIISNCEKVKKISEDLIKEKKNMSELIKKLIFIGDENLE